MWRWVCENIFLIEIQIDGLSLLTSASAKWVLKCYLLGCPVEAFLRPHSQRVAMTISRHLFPENIKDLPLWMPSVLTTQHWMMKVEMQTGWAVGRSKSSESASFIATNDNTTGTAFIFHWIHLSFFLPE